jgi:hypothetical protein
MGANLPEWKKKENRPQTPTFLPILGVIVFLAAVALCLRLALPEDIPGPKLNPKEEKKLQKRLREIDDSEQYALIARVNGWYPCLHSGRTSCYLLVGEVWKYGVTSKGKFGRYNSDFLLDNKVAYFIEFKGNFAECLKQEQIKLFTYPYLPENLARPPADRLPRPPYNSIMR